MQVEHLSEAERSAVKALLPRSSSGVMSLQVSVNEPPMSWIDWMVSEPR